MALSTPLYLVWVCFFGFFVSPTLSSMIIPIAGKRVSNQRALVSNELRRASMMSSRISRRKAGKRANADADGYFGNGTTTVINSGDNTEYFTNITLGGTQFEVIVDTGSADLWVTNNVQHTTQDLNISAEVQYGSGSVKGSISLSDLEFVGFSIPNQAYINVEVDDAGVNGILGLGPSASSQVLSIVGNETGAPPIDRIFEQNLSTPNFITLMLSRQEGQSNPTGLLSIGTVIPGLENITSQQKLPGLSDNIQHWLSLLDENGIILPDGSTYKTESADTSGPGSPSQLHVMFDSGTTYPQVSGDLADAIYGRIPNATFVSAVGQPGVWQFPCSYELTMSFKFGGVLFPVSPLDMSDYATTDDTTTCVSTFQQMSDELQNPNLAGHLDMILGMSFLRNAYLLLNFGDFIDGSPNNTSAPYIQLLPVTNPTEAHQDFVNVRLGGIDTTASQPPLLPNGQSQRSPSTVLDQVHHAIWTKWWFDVGVAVAGLLVVVVLCYIGVRVCRSRRRRSKVPIEKAFVPHLYGKGSYKPLLESNSET